MTNVTKLSRAARRAARVTDATATETRATNAAGVAAQQSALANAQNASQALATAVTNDGWALCKAECLAGVSGAALMALHDDKLARAFFGYGYAAAFLISRGTDAAVAAAKLDNPGWAPEMKNGRLSNWPELGQNLLAYGRLVMDRGVAPSKAGEKRELKPGMFERSELEQAAYKAANAAWARAIASTKDEKAVKKARKPRATKGEAAMKKPLGSMVKLEKAVGVKEVARVALELAIAEEKLAKAHANELPLSVKEAIAALAKATREAWEAVKDA